MFEKGQKKPPPETFSDPTSSPVRMDSPQPEEPVRVAAFPPPASPPSSIVSDHSPYEPSKEEATFYYYGLPSGPHLVARSSGLEWRHKWPGETHPRFKFLRHVGDHPITANWDPQLQRHIINALGGASWTSIDILRIGYEDTNQDNPYPVVLWIGVSRGSLTWREGMNIVDACVRILKNRNLFDIECEIRESEVWRHAPPSPPVPYLTPVPHTNVTAENQFPLTASLGQSIASEVYPMVEGTLGLYLKPGDSNPQAQNEWGLTCRHVILPGNSNDEYRFRPKTGQPRTNVLLPGDDTFLKLAKSAEKQLNTLTVYKNCTEESLDRATRMGIPLAEIQKARKTRDEALILFNNSRDFLNEILPRWQSAANRKLGHIVFAPPIEAADPLDSAEAFGPCRDWGLIALDKSRFSESPTNIVDVRMGLQMNLAQLLEKLNPHIASSHKFTMPDDGKLRLQQTVPIGELRRPEMLDKNGDHCLIVGKRGRTTGVTWGCGNEIKSCVRNIGKMNMISMEWCVLPDIDSKAFAPFSERGDSGSAVFDITGRVAGILAGGGGLTDKTDTTYVTPMAWIQEDMKKHGYSVEIV